MSSLEHRRDMPRRPIEPPQPSRLDDLIVLALVVGTIAVGAGILIATALHYLNGAGQ